MRILSLLTSTASLIILQTLVSTWFLFDFFLTRDSITANTLWNPNHKIDRIKDDDEIVTLSNKVRKKHCSLDENGKDEAMFNKVILIVIDGLGSQFIKTIENDDINERDFSMPFVENKIVNHQAISFVAKASTPTVTMPRIKALLSGTIPSFVDVMYNLARDVSKFTDDNIIRIAKGHNKSIVFYGDDTWLSLFDRRIFTRARETFSFYASDYTSVDTNVTNFALPETELSIIDWDYLILHYLGLDHIGHVFGTNKGSMIKNKLIEMDNVIEKIYKNISKKKELKTLVVICGDHGMSSEGNHGGNSKLEAETAMIFMPINQDFHIKDKKFDRQIKQIDFSTTLALLNGLPIPIMSKGVAIEPLLNSLIFNQKKLSCHAFENIIQLINLMDKEKFRNSHERVELITLLNNHYTSNNNLSNLSEQYLNLARKIQDKLIEIIAINSNPIFIFSLLTLTTVFSLIGLRRTSIHSLLILTIPKLEQFLCCIFLIIPIVMHGSTNFIESENLFWPLYCFISTSIFFSFSIITNTSLIKNLDSLRVILFIITHLITFSWNNFKLFRENFSNLTLTLVASAFLCNSMMQSCDLSKEVKKFTVIIMALGIMLCRIVEESPDYDISFVILTQRVILISLIVYTLSNLISSSTVNEDEPIARFIRKFSSSWLALTFLLARPYNLIFVIANVIMEASVNAIIDTFKLSRVTKVLIYIHFAQSAFYNQGNSNLFTTIDIRPAYYGQTEFNLILSIPLVIISSYSTQLYWYIKLFQRFQANNANDRKEWIHIKTNMMKSVLEFVTIRNFLSLSYYMYVCIVLRNHLFIWSVISPKLIYHFVTNNIILITCLLITLLHQTKTSLLKSANDIIGSEEKISLV